MVPVETAPPAPPAPPAAANETEPQDETEPLAPSPLAKTCKGVSLVLVSAKVDARYKVVDSVLELRNDSAEHVHLMLPGDGSSNGRRNPKVMFELTPNDVTPLMGCGNMNSISPEDFTFLAPSEKKRLTWAHLPMTPSKAGRYALRATYENDPTSTELGHNLAGPKTDALTARARKTVACRLVSNTLSFTWPG